MPNRLARETSTYLLQHAADPVDWYPWGEEAWSRARAENKPVLLSIGYASCHWCHVMQGESFAAPDIATALNKDFVAILVDREERPDLDGLYIEALQTLTGEAGWPLTLFLTPDRKLFFGGTYFPPVNRDDLPGFASVLDSVADEWQYNRRELQHQADGVMQQMRDRARTLPAPQPLTSDGFHKAIATIQESADQVYGGFGEAPKLPQPWLVDLMLRASARGPGGAHGIADLTLRRMARGGLYDQVGGGFHRYAVDPAWKIPHFEKMLYDNALLARVYTHAGQARADATFQRVAVETLDYLLAELRAPGGAFYAGQDSDTDGVEGGYYLWTEEEFLGVEGVTPQDATFFGVTAEGSLDGRSVLTARGDTLPEGARDRLRRARSGRTKPAVDTAILTSWNGLAIAALAEAGAAFDRPDFVAAAEAAAAFVLGRRGQDADLVHVHNGAPNAGQAEDYAYLTDGLFSLWEVTQDPRWIQECTSLARRMVDCFGDPDDAGLFSTAAAAATGVDGLALRRKDLIDGTTPSPNGVASLLLQRLGALWGDETLTGAGVAILQAASPTVQAFPQECGSLLAALDFFLAGPREIAVVGDRSRAETQALFRQVWSRFLPNRVLVGIPAGGFAPIDSPILAGRGEVDGHPTAYVCENHICKKPTADPAELSRQLRIAGQPTPEQVDRAAEFAAFTLHRISLFDRLDNPLWIAPLLERGFFMTPPSPLEHYIPGATGSPPWPDSKYLARMAGVDPFAVHRVALQIPDTQNSLVQEDLIDAALALPPDLAVDLARRAEGWLRASPHHVMLPKKLGSLLSALAKAGHGPVALDLARSLLELLPDPLREVRAIAAEEVFPAPPQPLARFGQWDYEQILNENYPDVVHALALPALDLLADLLDRALQLSRPQEADADSGVGADAVAGAEVTDGSYLWRPSIDENAHNVDRTLRNSLVSALREAAETIARENPGLLPVLVEHLTTRQWPVFRRLGLHLLRTFPEDAPGMAAAELARHDLLDNPHFSREYILLAHQQFNSPDSGISDDQRGQILAWVGEGPDLARWDAVPDRWGADPQDGEAGEGYRRQWTADRLAYLEGDGTGSDAALYAFVPRDPPVDLATPKQAEWVRTAPMEEVVRFCATWRPPTLIGAPAAGGLQRKLVEVATSEPGRFAGDTSALVDLPDDYLRALVAGLREACRQGTVFAWEPVLHLFAAVAGRKGPSARALRIGIAQCVAIGFNKSTTEIPQPLRQLVWRVLEPIATEEDHPGLPLVNASPILQRSVAAEGLQAVARYALWVRRQIETQPRGRELAKRGWEEMPEVRAVLEAHLAPDTAAQRSIEVQAFFGQWFPWLLMLDPEWAVASRDAIFPAEAEGDHLRQAAWDTYLAKTPVFDQVFELLAEDYAQTVAGLASGSEGSVGLTRPQQGFAEHLMALYLRGRIPLTPGQLPGQIPAAPDAGPGRDTLLVEFFSRAHPYQRAHALAWAGQMIQGQQERIPGEILSRLMRLWEARLAAAQEAGALVGPEALAEHVEELSSFGSWFASGKFEEGWAVRQLESLLTLTGRVGTTSKVVERLKASMETMPYEVVRCIAALVASERGAITILGWGKDAQQMLSRIVGGSDARARDIALDLLDTFDLQPITDLIRWN